MATKTIDQLNPLSSGSVVAANDVLPIVSISGNSTNKITVNDLKGAMNIQGGLAGTQYVYVAANGTDVENAAELQAAYNTAKTMSPSSTNRITVIASPGNYNFDGSFLEMDTQYVDLVSLDGNRSIIFNGDLDLVDFYINSIRITANNIFVKGVDVQTKQFRVETNLNSLTVENCKGGDYSFGYGVTVSGTFTNCTAGGSSFGGTTSGTFTNCTAGDNSFGGYGETASGTFTNCKSGNNSFSCYGPYGPGLASGTFTNCTAGSNSFGAGGGGSTASGTFIRCEGGNFSFAKSATVSGKFYYCIKTDDTFGTITGIAIHCIENMFGSPQPFNSGFTPQDNV